MNVVACGEKRRKWCTTGPKNSEQNEWNLHKARRWGTEGDPVFLIAGSEGQPRMAMITSQGRNDFTPASVCPCDLEGQVYGFSAPDSKYSIVQILRHQFRQKFGHIGSGFAHQVMITDVQLIEGLFQKIDQFPVPVPQVENATVAMEIEQLLGLIQVPQEWPFPLVHDKIHSVFLKKGDFTGGQMVSEALNGLLLNCQGFHFHFFLSNLFFINVFKD